MSGKVPAEPADRRVRRTREALHSALMALIVRQGFEATTIQQVLDEADVGRSTFYAHFSGKAALLRFGFTRLRQELGGRANPADATPFGFVVPLLAHARAHRGLYAALLGGAGGAIAHEEIDGIVRAHIAAELTGMPAAERDLAAIFLTAGLLAGLEAWLGDPTQEGAKHLRNALIRAAAGLAG